MNRPRLRLPADQGVRSGTTTTLLCIAGLIVAGLGLAYCVHLGAERGDDHDHDSTSAASLRYVIPSNSPTAMPPTVGAAAAPDTTSDLAITRSKMLLGTVDALSSSELAIHMSDGRTHRIALTEDTHYESAHSGEQTTGKQTTGRPSVQVGDVVVVHVLIKGQSMVADLVVDGRVTASRPGN